MAVTLKQCVEGKAPTPVAEQSYELAKGVVLTAKPPTYKIVKEFWEAGFFPDRDDKGKIIKDDDGLPIVSDERTHWEMVKDRLDIIFDAEELDWDDVYMPVAFQAHDDFFTFLSPRERKPIDS